MAHTFIAPVRTAALVAVLGGVCLPGPMAAPLAAPAATSMLAAPAAPTAPATHTAPAGIATPAAPVGVSEWSPLRGPYFWDAYTHAIEMGELRPDSALRIAERRIARDPQDFLGAWIRAALLARRDSAAAERAYRLPQDIATTAGAEVGRGTLHFVNERSAEGRVAFQRAEQLYLAAGRVPDAARCALWTILKDPARRSASEEDAAFARVESLAVLGGDVELQTEAQAMFGSRLSRRDAPASIRQGNRALVTVMPLAPCAIRAEAHRLLGINFKAIGQLDSSRAHYVLCEQEARACDAFSIVARAIFGIGTIAKARGDNPTCITLLTTALEMARSIKSESLEADVLGDLGNTYFIMGYYDEALRSFEASLALHEKSNREADSKVVTLDQLAGISVLTGDLDGARRYWERALEQCRTQKLPGREPFVLLHLAEFNLDLGDLEQADRCNQRGLALARQTGRKRPEVLLLWQHGEILLAQDKPEEALATLRTVRPLVREAEPRNETSVLRTEARALAALGRYQEGLAVIDTAEALLGAGIDSLSSVRLDTRRGALLRLLGRHAESVSVLDSALAIARALQAPNIVATISLELGASLLDADRPRESIPYIEAALRHLEAARASAGASADRIGFQSKWQEGYVWLASAQARVGDGAQAFATMDRSRGREMRAWFGSDAPARNARVSPALAAALGRTERDMAAVQRRLLTEYARPASERGPRARTLEARADSLQREWTSLTRQVERSTPDYARAAGLAPGLASADVQRALAANERLVAFMVGSDRTLLFDVRRDAFAVHELPWTEDGIARRVATLLAACERPGAGDWRALAAALADSLLAPCRLGSSSATTLYIVPDGALHVMPFEVLPVADANGARRLLVERTSVIYGSSPSLLFSGRSGESATQRAQRPLAAFGDPAVAAAPAQVVRGAATDDALLAEPSNTRAASGMSVGPLPYARREVEGLSALYPDGIARVGASASEGAFYSEFGRARRLHVAAHGFVDDRDPRFSGLVLARDSSASGASDGLVQAFEVLDRRCDAELVTLSACETGRGRVLRGEGLEGLGRAFQLAGARNLVVSLWKVDDAATADFMVAFYTRLKAGAAPDRALTETKRAFLAAVPAGGTTGAGAARGAEPQTSPGAASPAPAGVSPGANETEASATEGVTGTRGVGLRSASAERSHPSVWAAFVLIGSRPR